MGFLVRGLMDWWRRHVVGTVPDDLGRCEFSCREGECLRETCPHYGERATTPGSSPDS